MSGRGMTLMRSVCVYLVFELKCAARLLKCEVGGADTVMDQDSCMSRNVNEP